MHPSSHPQVMGILNITPNSFCETGRFLSPESTSVSRRQTSTKNFVEGTPHPSFGHLLPISGEKEVRKKEFLESALTYAQKMVDEGADLIDIGGEPTSPGVHPVVSLQEELDRVIPVVSLLAKHLPVPLSVDTSKPKVMEEAIRCGASFINDVRALQYEGALEIIAKHQVRVCLMHMQFPNGIQNASIPSEINIITLIKNFLEQRITACLNAGIAPEKIVIDPGIGGGSFGKTTEQNCEILARLEEFKTFGFPILIGTSRKLFIGDILGNAPVKERLYGSLAANIIAVANGAHIIRTHDVRATVDAIKVMTSIGCRPTSLL